MKKDKKKSNRFASNIGILFLTVAAVVAFGLITGAWATALTSILVPLVFPGLVIATGAVKVGYDVVTKIVEASRKRRNARDIKREINRKRGKNDTREEERAATQDEARADDRAQTGQQRYTGSIGDILGRAEDDVDLGDVTLDGKKADKSGETRKNASPTSLPAARNNGRR